MSKTVEIRKVIKAQLETVMGSGHVFHRDAPDDADFPYSTFALLTVNMGDLWRDDIDLQIDLFDHHTSPQRIEELADRIEALLGGANLPQDEILPTIYRVNRQTIPTQGKLTQCIQMRFLIQNYTREE